MRNEKPTALFEVRPRPGADAEATAGDVAALADTWIPSRFNVTVDLPGRQTALYNTFTGAIAVLPRGAWPPPARALTARPPTAGLVPSTLLDLQAKGFLVPRGIDEIDLLRRHFAATRHANDLLAVNLLPTMACNLRCPYCFEGRARTLCRGGAMSRRTERAAAGHIVRAARDVKHLSLCWFGGEPLLAMGAIERISAEVLPACAKAGIRTHATVVTNGTGLTAGAVRRLRASSVTLAQVTVDVPKASKRDRFGRDTLGPVLDNLRHAARTMEVHIRVNLTRDDEAEFDHLYDEMIRRDLHRHLKSIMIAHVFVPECGRGGCASATLPSRDYLDAVRREVAKARARGLPVHRFFSTQKSGGCSATRERSMCIGPDGLLYKCVEDVGLTGRAYGSVHLEGHVKPGNLLPWLTYDGFRYDRCRRCPVLPQCAGGCAHKRLFQPGRLRPEDFCYWNIRGDLEERVREHALALLRDRS
jgi:uncharacterized protein